MAKFFDELNEKLTKFVASQKIFFVATAATDGRINLSPKGYDALKILGPNRILWLNLSGSGNETAAHLKVSNRITLMFCAFEDPPLIMRIYGTAQAVHPRDAQWETLISHFDDLPGSRQIFDMKIESVQTSCGWGVPYFDFAGERSKLVDNFKAKDTEAIEDGWAKNNAVSIDGLETGIIVADEPSE